MMWMCSVTCVIAHGVCIDNETGTLRRNADTLSSVLDENPAKYMLKRLGISDDTCFTMIHRKQCANRFTQT